MIEYPYHMHVKMISRKKGHNAVAAAAYRSGQRLTEKPALPSLQKTFNDDEDVDETDVPEPVMAHDYRRRKGVMGSFIIAPKLAPAWARDRGMLWNAVEEAEKRKDAQVAREVVVSLPDIDIFDHLTDENKPKRQQEFYERILRSFVNDNFVKEGMIADVALHAPSDKNDDRHFHAHIMLTTREVGADGFGKKTEAGMSLRSWRLGERDIPRR